MSEDETQIFIRELQDYHATPEEKRGNTFRLRNGFGLWRLDAIRRLTKSCVESLETLELRLGDLHTSYQKTQSGPARLAILYEARETALQELNRVIVNINAEVREICKEE